MLLTSKQRNMQTCAGSCRPMDLAEMKARSNTKNCLICCRVVVFYMHGIVKKTFQVEIGVVGLCTGCVVCTAREPGQVTTSLADPHLPRL